MQTTAAFVIAAGIPVSAYADPQGGSVSSGSASISSANGHTIIDQSSDRAIIRWDSFDIDSAEHVQFRQPTSSSITVNRIMDSKASRIDGRLSANGNIVLINPNGMVFGSSAVVDVGGLVATTSDLGDDNEFMSGGAVKFTRPGNADAKIVNNGSVTVKDAGLAGLVAPQVENNGVIQARMGRVQLASGDIHTIDFAGDGLIKLEVSAAVGKQAVINRGTINANGGDVLITAAQAKHVVDVLVENSGTVRANTVGHRAGTIKISTKGIDDTTEKAKGRIVNTGAVYAMGDDTGEAGGSIRILADDIAVGDGSVVDASGDTDGGEILLGGDYQGGGNVPTSDYLRIDRNVTLNAGSRRTGKGGKIIGWADMDTLFYGHAVASAADGDGGLIEMSGKRYLDFGGAVDLRGVNGASGILLLDPTDITISSGADSNVTGASPYTPTADSVTSVLNASTLLAALASGNVIVQTRATGAQSGNITVADALSWASGNALTLDAHGQIIINAAISGGSLEMIAGADVALNAAVGGTGTLTIQQRADATTIGIGASAVGVLNLSAADLLNIQNGWSDIVLGRETATGAMDIRGTTWTDNLTLRSGTGVINVMGVVDTGANNMTVIAGGDIAIAAAGRQLTGTGTLTIRPSTTTTTVGLGAAGNINLTTTEIARLHGTWADVIIGRTDSSVAMAVAAVTWNDALTLMNGTGAINVTGVQTMGTNALTFITDGDIALGVTNTLFGSTTLTFKQASANVGIGLGDAQAGGLSLNNTDVARIRNGWTTIVMGRSDATAATNVGALTWNDHLTLNSGTGAVNITGKQTMGANNLIVNTNGGAVNLTGGVDQTGANLTVNTAGGAIDIAGALSGTTGTWTFGSNNGLITIGNTITKTGGALNIDSGTSTLTIGAAISGAATAMNIAVSGAADIHINNTLTTTTGAVSLTTAGGKITSSAGGAISQTTGNVSMATNGGQVTLDGTVTQGGAAASGNLTITSGGGAVALNNTITRLAGIMTVNAGAGGITVANTIGLSASALDFDVTGAGIIDLDGGLTMGAGALSMNSDSGVIDIAGPISITTGATNIVSGSGNIILGDSFTTTTGAANLTSGGGKISTKGISQTTGSVSIASGGGNVLVDGGVTQASGASGNFSLTTGGGTAGVTGAISRLAGTTAIDAGAGGIIIGGAVGTAAGAIDFDASGAANITVGGALSVTTGAVTINTAAGDILLKGITQTTGNVTLGATGGKIQIDGAVTQNGGAASGNMTATGVGVSVTGAVTRLAGMTTFDGGTGGVSVGGLMNLGASGLDLDASGAGVITLSNALTMGAGNFTANTTGGNISTKAITQTTGATTLASGNGAIMIDGAISKTGGTLDANSGTGQLTFAGAVALGAGAAILTTDSNISLGGAFSGTGAFTLAQANNNVSIGVGTGQAGTVHLDDTEFGYIQDGWSSRTFGRSDSTAAMNIKGGLTWTDSLILQTGTGAMNLNGAIAVGAGNGLTLRTDSDVNILGDLSGTGAFALVQSTNATGMGIGDGQAGTVHVGTAEQARILNGWSGITLGRTDSTAAMNVFSATWNDSLVVRSGSGQMTIAGAAMLTNSITMITDSDIAINGNITGSGTLAVYGATAATSMGIGDGQAGTIGLSNAELTRFGSTWGSQVFGVSSMSGDINIGTRTWGDPLSLRAGTGVINVNGVVTMGGNNIALTTDGDINIDPAGKLVGTGSLTIASTLAATSFGLGDGQSGTVTLSTSEIGRMNGTFSGITIGGTGNTGSINLGALTWNDPVVIRNGAGAFNVNGEQNAGGNNLTLYTNSNISINDLLTGTGTLSIYGGNSTSIGVGTGQAGTLSLSDDELNRIATGWTSVIIGSTSMTGAMNIAGRTWNNSMDFRTNSGAMNINGAQNMGSNNLILRTNTNLSIGQILAGTGTLSILNSGTANTNTMGVGDGQAGQLQLSNAETDMFKGYGWTTIALGNSSSQGALNVGAGTWSSNLVLRNAGSASNFLKINGAINVGSNNLTLQSNNDIYIDFGISGTGTLTIGQVSATIGLGVGDGQTGAVAISNAELARATGWGSMVFGTTATTTSAYAAINIGAYTWNNNLTLRSNGNAININGAQNLGAHNLTFDTGANPTIGAALNGTGTLSFNPYAVATTVGIAGGAGTLALSAGELAQIGAGWDKISIGRSDGTGAMVVSSTTWNNNLFLTTGTGLLTVAGANMGSKNLEIATNSNLTITGNLSGTGALTIRNSSGLNSIGVGAAGSNITLDSTEISKIQDGWSYVQIGSENSFGDINIAANNWLNPMRFVTKSDIVVNGAQTTTETSGTSMVFATTAGKFINNAGGSAINPGGGRYLVYSIDEANDTIGGLLRPTILTNLSYAGYGPTAVTETGDVYIYAGTAARILTLMINDVDKVYGDLNPTYTYSYVAGLQNGDILSNIILTSSMSAAGSNVLDNAGTTRLINGSFTLDGGYTLNLITGTLTVIKASVTVTADSDSREYGVANGALTISYDGFRNGDDETVLSSQATASTAATILSNVGSYAITASGAADSNYDFIYVDGTLDITKATLNATVQNATREYGAADPAFNIVYSGFRNGDTQAVIDTLGTGTTAATATSNVGSYAINGGGAVDNNYAFNYIDGSLSITKAMLTATTQSDTREYGVANPTLGVVYTGFRNGETAAVIDTLATASTAAVIGSNVGSYGISATGAADNNYDFTYANTGNLSVTKAMLTVTADNNARVYGDANPAFTVSYSGFRNGDTATSLTTQATAGAAATVLSDVGSYAITATGAASGNYDFTYNQGSLSVTKAMLTVTTQDNTREYGLANPVLSASYSGFRNGDTFGVIDTAATVSSLAGLTSNVGSYGITATGASDNNYDFTYANTGTLSVTKAMLTATTQNATREYGIANPALGVVYTGFRNGETSSVIDTLATASTAAVTGSNVGSYGISASGAVDNNYDFTYANTGNLSVTKAMLTVTADSNSRVYGAANPALGVSYSGFRNGDTATSLITQATAATGATVLSDAGTYAITASGAAAGNYDFTYAAGVLTVGKADITATVSSATREYGAANPAFTVAYTGFVNGDDETDINVSAGISAPGATTNVGTHAVSASGGSDNNYNFVYVDGALTVTKAMLTATAADATRAAGAANPTFTVNYTGFRNGETASVIDTPATASSVADASSPVGTYAILASGALDNNYDFTYVSGILDVTGAVAPTPTPVTSNGSTGGSTSIPVTVEDVLTGRNIRHAIVTQPYNYNVRDIVQSGIAVISEDSIFNRNTADNSFLIAITEKVKNFDFGYNQDEDPRQ